MATKEEITKILMTLLASFPAFQPKVRAEEMRDAYHAILGDLEAERLMKAAVHLCSTQRFFPAAAELRAAYFELAERASDVPSAQDAWAEVCYRLRVKFRYVEGRGIQVSRLMREHAWGGSFEVGAPTAESWSNPLIQKAIDAIGGWVMLCHSENEVADRARFLEAYNVYLARERETVRMLPGVQQVVKRLAGQAHPKLPEPVQMAEMEMRF
jgi:hypothetical protein